jgi:hypothetical protein
MSDSRKIKIRDLLDKLKVLRDDRQREEKEELHDILQNLTNASKYKVGLNIIINILGYVKTLEKWYTLIDEQDVYRQDRSINGGATKKVRNVCTNFLETIGFYFVKTKKNGDDTVVIDGEIGNKVQNNPEAHELCTSFAKLIQNEDIYFWTLDLQQAFRVTDHTDKPITRQTEQQQAASIMKTAVNGIWSCIQDFKELEISD